MWWTSIALVSFKVFANSLSRQYAHSSNPAGTSDEAAALKDDDGKPVANAARNTWVTETALSTALNVSYMASQISLFGIVVGIALVLAGIGFLILGARRLQQA